MSILSRYIARNLLSGWLIAALVLSSIFGLIFFIQEVEHTLRGYQVKQVTQYVLMILPQEMIKLAPVIALLGTIIALAGLDRFNELTIISCCGASKGKLLRAVLLPTALLMIALWFCMEYVSAPLHQRAEHLRFTARQNSSMALPHGGVWSRHGHHYMYLGAMLEGDRPASIRLYEFNDDGLLIRYLRAREATIAEDRTWHFKGIRQKRIINGRMHTTTPRELEIENLWSREELPSVTTSADDMSLSVLYEHTQYLSEDGQSNDKYLMSFWQRAVLPLTVGAMVLLATPISANLGSRRNNSFGASIVAGAAIGIGFFLLAQITYSLGQLLGINLLLTSILPTLAVLLCGLVLLSRMRW